MNRIRLLLLWLLLSTLALAHDPAGAWTSSSGARIDLWANMEQVQVTVTTPDGVQKRYSGFWTQFSDQFRYQVGSVIYDCSFQGPNQILVRGSGVADRVWNRGWSGTPVSSPPVQSSDPSGLYLSSSGSSVQLTSRGGQVSLTFVNRQGQATVANGQWVSSNRFEYYFNGSKAICTLDNSSPGRIYVQSPSGTTVWTRQ